MPELIAVGRDIDAHCTRCKLVLAHTILAMVGPNPVRVKCNTCHSDRNYKALKAEKPARAASSSSPSSAARPAKAASSGSSRSSSGGSRGSAVETAWELEQKWLDVLGQARRANALEVPFALSTTFNVGQIVRHTKFGDGVVVAAETGRMTVRFQAGEKVLAHGRTE